MILDAVVRTSETTLNEYRFETLDRFNQKREVNMTQFREKNRGRC